MAGIGFSLRKILKNDSLSNIGAAYTVAGIIAGGPWIISILGIVILSALVSYYPQYYETLNQFRISITYLIAGSIILSSPFANSFARYIADQLFLKKSTSVISNLNGLMLVLTIGSGCVGFLFIFFGFPKQDLAYKFLLLSCFVVLSNIWVVVNLLTAIKNYKKVLFAFLASYLFLVVIACIFKNYSLNVFMLVFLISQLILMATLLVSLYQEFPTNNIIDFHFLEKGNLHKTIIYTGLLFNVGVWIDKFIFWYFPATSHTVIGIFRSSLIYDVPVFIAYLCLLPGLAVFLLLIETDFTDYYESYHEGIRSGKPLSYIEITGERMITSAFEILYSIVKVQAITIIIVYQFGNKIFTTLGVPILYYNLLYILVIGSSFQVIFLAIIGILYYMDKRWNVFVLSLLFCILNLVFTWISVHSDPFYYGFGLTLSLAVVCIYGVHLLNEEFNNLEYKVIMLHERG